MASEEAANTANTADPYGKVLRHLKQASSVKVTQTEENCFSILDISHDEEFIKEETIRKGYVRRSARTAQKNSQSGKTNDAEAVTKKSKLYF